MGTKKVERCLNCQDDKDGVTVYLCFSSAVASPTSCGPHAQVSPREKTKEQKLEANFINTGQILFLKISVFLQKCPILILLWFCRFCLFPSFFCSFWLFSVYVNMFHLTSSYVPSPFLFCSGYVPSTFHLCSVCIPFISTLSTSTFYLRSFSLHLGSDYSPSTIRPVLDFLSSHFV